MGGEQQGTTAASDLLQQQQQREAMANAIKQGFQQWGAAVAQPVAAPQLGGQQSALADYGQMATAPQTPAGALGPLFPQGRGGGISEAQLAEILRQLGYAGQGLGG
jgi:hypothetical protein